MWDKTWNNYKYHLEEETIADPSPYKNIPTHAHMHTHTHKTQKLKNVFPEKLVNGLAKKLKKIS